MCRVLELVNDRDNWATESNGISYKPVLGTPTVSLLMESTLDVPLEHFLAIVYETELYPMWLPFCKSTTLVAQLGRTRKILLNEFSVARVLHRESVLYGFGFNLLHSHGAVLLCCHSCDEASSFKGVSLPPEGETQRIHLKAMGCLLTPLSPVRTHVRLVTNVDPKLRVIPYKLLNFFLRKFAKGLFSKLSQLAANYENSEFQYRRNEESHKAFYEHINKSLEVYFSAN